MFLQGAKTSAGIIAVGMIAAIMAAAPMAAPLAAQDASSAGQARSSAAGRLDVAVTYNAALSDASSGSSFWLQGGSAEVEGRFYRGLGAVAEISGMHTANINSSGVALDLVTAAFGPRYTWIVKSRYDVFGQGMVGEAWGMNSVFPNTSGANTMANSLAVKAGGGLNIELAQHFALRAFEADYLRTQLPNGNANVQNNLLLGAGIVLRFR